jgi:hypothetical protein
MAVVPAPGVSVNDDLLARSKAQIAAVRHERASLAEQIEQTQQAIRRSQELLKHIDALLAKAGESP